MCGLAFAVAAHLEPEILLVDEVLAVGDATYQRRCLDRMNELANNGITILFVSHNMDLIPRLCRKAVLLEKGSVQCIGSAANACEAYLRSNEKNLETEDLRDKQRRGIGRAQFVRLQLQDGRGYPCRLHKSGQDPDFSHMDINAKCEIRDVALGSRHKVAFGENRLVTSWTKEVDFRVDLEKGLQKFHVPFSPIDVAARTSLSDNALDGCPWGAR